MCKGFVVELVWFVEEIVRRVDSWKVESDRVGEGDKSRRFELDRGKEMLENELNLFFKGYMGNFIIYVGEIEFSIVGREA